MQRNVNLVGNLIYIFWRKLNLADKHKIEYDKLFSYQKYQKCKIFFCIKKKEKFRGMWSQGEKTYFDVRVTHTNALSNRGKTLDQIYRQNENEKKNLYNERIINVEKSSFTPLVFSTSGGMAPECLNSIKELLSYWHIKEMNNTVW